MNARAIIKVTREEKRFRTEIFFLYNFIFRNNNRFISFLSSFSLRSFPNRRHCRDYLSLCNGLYPYFLSSMIQDECMYDFTIAGYAH